LRVTGTFIIVKQVFKYDITIHHVYELLLSTVIDNSLV